MTYLHGKPVPNERLACVLGHLVQQQGETARGVGECGGRGCSGLSARSPPSSGRDEFPRGPTRLVTARAPTRPVLSRSYLVCSGAAAYPHFHNYHHTRDVGQASSYDETPSSQFTAISYRACASSDRNTRLETMSYSLHAMAWTLRRRSSLHRARLRTFNVRWFSAILPGKRLLPIVIEKLGRTSGPF